MILLRSSLIEGWSGFALNIAEVICTQKVLMPLWLLIPVFKM